MRMTNGQGITLTKAMAVTGILGVGAGVASLVLEHGLGFVPCRLCIEQRVTIFLAGALSLLAGFARSRHRPGLYSGLAALAALAAVVGLSSVIEQGALAFDMVASAAGCTAENPGAFGLPADLGPLLSAEGDCGNVDQILGVPLFVYSGVLLALMAALASADAALSIGRPVRA